MTNLTAVKLKPKEEKAETVHESQRVIVTDISMNFSSMVRFMVKWTFATIPAFIIVVMMTIASVWLSICIIKAMPEIVEWIMNMMVHLQRMW